MDNRPIGIFDSGFGGLTAVRALRAICPEENIVFFADNGRAPYGGRPREQLRLMARQNLSVAASSGAKLIFAACGTLSSNAADILAAYPVPAFGVLDAAVAEIAREQSAAPIGVIATEATIRSGAFERALRAACPGREVFSMACPAFVPLIESGRVSRDDPKLQRAVEYYLQPLKEQGVGTLLLGCTHYGLIEDVLLDDLGDQVRLVDASACAAAFILQYLEKNDLRGGEGSLLCLTSGEKERFEQLAPLFLGQEDPPRTEQVPVMPAEEET
ncbi:MAG: glutamate racemase [Clostridia bacterium]